jgi:hypothetical protein
VDRIGSGRESGVPVAVAPGGRRTGWLLGFLLGLLLLVSLVGAGLVMLATQQGDRSGGALVGALPSPSPSLSATGSPSGVAQLLATASSRPLIGGAADPVQLPRFPGSTLLRYDEGVDGSISWVMLDYLAAGALLDDVREHYRQVFREADWFVGDVDYSAGVWSFTVNQGSREARLEIFAEGEAVRAVAFVSDTTPPAVAPATPTAEPAPKATRPPRVQQPPRDTRPRVQSREDDRPKRAPERRPDRDDDDDDDDDDD